MPLRSNDMVGQNFEGKSTIFCVSRPNLVSV